MSADNVQNNVAHLMGMDEAQARKHWGWTLFLGILFLVCGIFAIIAPLAAGVGLQFFLGWLLVITGIVEAVRAFQSTGWKGFLLDLLLAVIYVGGGLLLVFRPLAGLLAMGTLIPFFFIVEGIFRIILSIRMEKGSGWGWVLFHGIFSIFVGVLLFSQWPFSALWVPGLIVGIWMIYVGVTTTAIATAVRRALKAGEGAPEPSKPEREEAKA